MCVIYAVIIAKMNLKIVTFHGHARQCLWRIYTFLIIGFLVATGNCEYGEFGKFSGISFFEISTKQRTNSKNLTIFLCVKAQHTLSAA